MDLILSTRNAHKLREFDEMLAPHTVLPLPDEVVLPPETGETFEENALGKARAAAAATGGTAIADDSGIAASALGGRPGGYSARYAGEAATGEEHVVGGRCEGTLAQEPRGDGGFGYDPAFIPADRDDGRTMSELTPDEK